jgi:hypothetical protein
LMTRIPSLEDSALSNLHDNADRLAKTGTKAQQAAATEILPALEAELAARKAAKLDAAKKRRAAARRPTKKASA